MDKTSKVHLLSGGIPAAISVIALLFDLCGLVSGAVVIFINFYLVAILVEAAIRSGGERKIANNILESKPPHCFEFPSRGWALALTLFFAITVICGFANMYIQRAEVVYVGPNVEAGKVKAENKVSTPDPSILEYRIEALYFSMVTITTLGYGDFLPASSSTRMLVMWQLGTGILLLLGIFPLVVARVADF